MELSEILLPGMTEGIERRLIAFATLAAATAILYWLLTRILISLERRQHRLADSIRTARDWLIPSVAFLGLLDLVMKLPAASTLMKASETIVGVEAIWLIASLLTLLVFARRNDEEETWRSRIPNLLLDIIRFAVALIGASVVVAHVWQKDLGAFLATLGIGSIVLGLALQDTLGNLFAGIALVFERPFLEGDWIKIGETIGQVIEVNWRAVRLRTRAMDLVTVPNSVLGKERIHNFSRPTPMHAVETFVGFSYNDPPNKVKEVLLKILEATPGVLRTPSPLVRTLGYRDSSIEYQVKYFIENYAPRPDIEEAFLTQIWYAARRHKLNIPFPVRTVLKTEQPYQPPPDSLHHIQRALSEIALFSALEDSELERLAAVSEVHSFARGERIIHQGDPGDALYVIRFGQARVLVKDLDAVEREVSPLGPGSYFGEMALLTGEARSATISALTDIEVIKVDKRALAPLIETRPSLAEDLARLAQERIQGTHRVLDEANTAKAAPTAIPKLEEGHILSRIKRFFGLS